MYALSSALLGNLSLCGFIFTMVLNNRPALRTGLRPRSGHGLSRSRPCPDDFPLGARSAWLRIVVQIARSPPAIAFRSVAARQPDSARSLCLASRAALILLDSIRSLRRPAPR